MTTLGHCFRHISSLLRLIHETLPILMVLESMDVTFFLCSFLVKISSMLTTLLNRVASLVGLPPSILACVELFTVISSSKRWLAYIIGQAIICHSTYCPLYNWSHTTMETNNVPFNFCSFCPKNGESLSMVCDIDMGDLII